MGSSQDGHPPPPRKKRRRSSHEKTNTGNFNAANGSKASTPSHLRHLKINDVAPGMEPLTPAEEEVAALVRLCDKNGGDGLRVLRDSKRLQKEHVEQYQVLEEDVRTALEEYLQNLPNRDRAGPLSKTVTSWHDFADKRGWPRYPMLREILIRFALEVFFGVYWSPESRRKLIGMLDEVKAVTDAVFHDFVKQHGTTKPASQDQSLAEWSVTAGAMTISKEQGIWIKERLASAVEDSDEAESSSSDEVARQLVEAHNNDASALKAGTRTDKERASSSEDEPISQGNGSSTVANTRRTVVIENGNHTADLAVGLHLTNGHTHPAEGNRKRSEQGSSSEDDPESDVDSAKPSRKAARTESKEEQGISETEEDAKDELVTSSEADEPSSRAGSPRMITETTANEPTPTSVPSPSASTARQAHSDLPPAGTSGRIDASNATSISDPALAAAFGARKSPSQPASPARSTVQLQSSRAVSGRLPVSQVTSEQAAANHETQATSIAHAGTAAQVAVGPPRARPRQNAPRPKAVLPPSGSVIEIFDTDEEDEIAKSTTKSSAEVGKSPIDIVQSLPAESEDAKPNAASEPATQTGTDQATEQTAGNISLETLEVDETAQSEIDALTTSASASPANSTSINNAGRRPPALDSSTNSPPDGAVHTTGRKPPLQPPGASLALSDSVPPLLAPVPVLSTFTAPERRSSTPIVLGYHERPSASPTSRNALLANGEASEAATERKAAESRASEDSQATAPDEAIAADRIASLDLQQERQTQQISMPKVSEVIGRGMSAIGSAAMAVKQAVFPLSLQNAASPAADSSNRSEKSEAMLAKARKPTTAPVGLSASTAPPLLPKGKAQRPPSQPAEPVNAIPPVRVQQPLPRPRVRSPPVERWSEVFTNLQRMINDQTHANSEAGYDRRAAHLETAAYLREEAEDRKVVQTFEGARRRRRKERQDHWQRTFDREATSATPQVPLSESSSSVPKPATAQESVEPPPPASMARIGTSRNNASTSGHVDRAPTISQYTIRNLPQASLPPPTVTTQSSQALQAASAQLKPPTYIPVPTKISRPLRPANYWYPVRRGKDTTTPTPLFIGRARGDIERPASTAQSSVDRSATATPDLSITGQSDRAHQHQRSDAQAAAPTSSDQRGQVQSQVPAVLTAANPSTTGQAAHSDLLNKAMTESQTSRTHVSLTHPVMQHYTAMAGRGQTTLAGAMQAEASRTQAAGQALTGIVQAPQQVSGTSGQRQYPVQPIPPYRGNSGNPVTRPASLTSSIPLPSLESRNTAGTGSSQSATPGQGTHSRHASDSQMPTQPARPDSRAALRTSTSSAAAPAGGGQNATIDPALLHRSTSGNQSIHVNPAHPVWNHTVPQQAASIDLRSHSRSSSGGTRPPLATSQAGPPQISHSRQASQQISGAAAQANRLRQSISGQGAQSIVSARDASSQQQTQAQQAQHQQGVQLQQLEQQRMRQQQQQQQQPPYRQQQMQTVPAPSQTLGQQQMVAHQPLRSHLIPANWAAQTPETEAALQRAYAASRQLEEYARTTGQTADRAYIQSKIAELRTMGFGTADVAMFEMRCIYYMVEEQRRRQQMQMQIQLQMQQNQAQQAGSFAGQPGPTMQYAQQPAYQPPQTQHQYQYQYPQQPQQMYMPPQSVGQQGHQPLSQPGSATSAHHRRTQASPPAEEASSGLPRQFQYASVSASAPIQQTHQGTPPPHAGSNSAMAQERQTSQPPQNMQQNQSSPLHLQQAMYMQQLQAQQMLVQQQLQQQQQHQYGRQGSPSAAGTAQTLPQGRQGSAAAQSPTVPVNHSRQASVSGFNGQHPSQQREPSTQSQAGQSQYPRQSSIAPLPTTAYSGNGPIQQRTPTPVAAATPLDNTSQQQNRGTDNGLRQQSPMSGPPQTRYHL